MVKNNLDVTYFIIIKDNGFIKPYILSFTEIEVVVDIKNFNFTYYKLSIKGLRKLKLLNITNNLNRERFRTLQNILNDTRFIKKYNDKPEPEYNFYNYHGRLYGLYSYYLTNDTKVKIKLNTKNTSYKNRFLGKVSKNIDFHKSNYKR